MTGDQHVGVMQVLRRRQPHLGTGLRCGKSKIDLKLSAAEVESLSHAFPRGAAADTRYPAGGMKGVYI